MSGAIVEINNVQLLRKECADTHTDEGGSGMAWAVLHGARCFGAFVAFCVRDTSTLRLVRLDDVHNLLVLLAASLVGFLLCER